MRYKSMLRSDHPQPEGTRAAPSVRHYLWQLLRYKPWIWLLTILAYLLLYGLNFAPPLIARAIFNRLTGDAPVQFGLWTLVLLLLGSAVARQAAYVALTAGQVLHGSLLGAVVRANLLQQLLEHPAARPTDEAPGALLSRFRDDIQPLSTFLGNAFNLVGVGFFALLAAVTMIRINPWLTLVAFVPLLLVGLAIDRSSQRISRLRAANQIATSKVTGLLGELFGAVQAIKVADAEGRVIRQLEVVNERRRQAALRDRLVTELFGALGGNLGDLGTALVLLFMGQAMRTGSFTVGDFALFIYVMPFVASNLRSVAGVLTSYRQLGVSLQRLAALLPANANQKLTQHRPVAFWGQAATGPAVDPGTLPATPRAARQPLELLTVTDLSFHYPDSTNGIDACSFQLPRGSFTVLTGPVGAGKSTLLRVLLGLLPKSRGAIQWNGELVTDPASFFQPPQSAYTPQVPRLFSTSLRENILLGHPNEAGLAAAIHAAALEADVAALPDGLATVVGPRGMRLSGGQIQRTAAARIFVRQPALCIFDDLSSALDVETEAALWQRLDPAATYLVVSHRPAALQRADQILQMSAGRLSVKAGG